MAYINQEDDEKQDGMSIYGTDQQQTAQPSTTSQQGQQIVSGQSAQVGAGPTTQQTAPKAKGSGFFTNLQKYLTANQNAGQRMGEALGQQFQAKASDIGKAVEEKQQQFKTQAEAQTQQAQQARQQGLQMISQAGKGLYDPTQFQQYLQGQYGQSEELQPFDISEQRTAAEQLQRQAEMAQSVGGRSNLLQEVYSQPGRQYGSGFSRLDALLLQGGGGAQQVAQQAQEAAQRASQPLTAAEDTGLSPVEQAALDQQQQLEAQRQLLTGQGDGTLQGALRSAQEQLATETERRAEEAFRTRQAIIANLQQSASQGGRQLTKTEMEQLGITPVEANTINLRGITSPQELEQALRDIGRQRLIGGGSNVGQASIYDYISGLDQTIGKKELQARLATPEELARAKALAELSGTGAQTIFTDPSLVGQRFSTPAGLQVSSEVAQRNVERANEFISNLPSLLPGADSVVAGKGLQERINLEAPGVLKQKALNAATKERERFERQKYIENNLNPDTYDPSTKTMVNYITGQRQPIFDEFNEKPLIDISGGRAAGDVIYSQIMNDPQQAVNARQSVFNNYLEQLRKII